ncbi:MAG TPA: Rrf2 family transcriptional regulator [Planctomycetota bacterium]|nr:Rrf2 family transcriptional regulator [Planctomycetota bacterium]
MIRFSRMADYGVLLLGHFASHEQALASTSELAETYHMPRPVVANLLKEFCKAGLLESRRGLHGGYRLARPATDISLLDVLSVIDGPVQLIDCAVLDIAGASGQCGYEDVCPSRSPMRAVHRRIIDLLDGISLSELLKTHEPVPARQVTTP